MPLSKEEREALPDSDFAVPGKRKLPIHDEKHARLAWDMVDRTNNLSDAERSAARQHILHRAKILGVDTSGWGNIHAAAIHLFAMSLDLPEVAGHPNRMPFHGILSRVDQPSDQAVGGSGGRRTVLPRNVAEAALPSLLGMPIDFTPNFDGHDVRRKIGTITGANVEGDAVVISGFFYKADFPQECARIKREKEALGFSYEVQAQTLPTPDGLLQIVSCTFTGAAVLYKDKAAYQSTSLAAHAVTEISMTKEEMQALLAEGLKPVTDQIGVITTDVAALKAGSTQLHANKELRERIAPHAAALRSCATAMEAAGVGLHAENGHVRILHHMAAHMEAAAAQGQVPYVYRDHDWTFRAAGEPEKKAEDPTIKALTEQISGLTTVVTDLKAASFAKAEEPQRKTLSAEATALLSKTGLKPDEKTGKISITTLDAAIEKSGLNRQAGMSLKLALSAAGTLAQ